MTSQYRRRDSSKGTSESPAPLISVEDAEGGRYMRVLVEGVVAVRTLEATLREILAHDGFVSGMGTLWDLRGADVSNTTSADLRHIRQSRLRVANQRGKGKVALLAHDDLTFGISRMVEASTAIPGIQMMVFRSEGQAIAWVSDTAGR